MNDICVVFNSRQDADGINRNDLTYHFDWSQIQNTAYSLTFTFTAEQNTLNGDKIAMVYMDLGTTPRMFRTSSTNYANFTQYLGSLRITTTQGAGGTKSFHTADDNQNGHIHIQGRPMNQNPRIRILDATGAPYTDSAGNQIGHYVLTLRLQKEMFDGISRYDKPTRKKLAE